MKRFKFKLERALNWRERQEQAAKDAFLEARSARIEAESELVTLSSRRQTAMLASAPSLGDRLALEGFHQRLDDDARQLRAIIAVLQQEEDAKRNEWTEARRRLELMQKLKEKALSEWTYEANRREQAELDEWATTRRLA